LKNIKLALAFGLALISISFSCKSKPSEVKEIGNKVDSIIVTKPISDTLLASENNKDAKSETLTGYFTYFADAAIFTICGSGKKLPISMEGKYIDAERAYLSNAKENAEAIFVEIIGKIEIRNNGEDKMTPHIVIEKLIQLDRNKNCE
jgi:uncharacterized lipoprotein NlpE involved in copper resistance